MLSCSRRMLPDLAYLRFESPPGQRDPALAAEVADVIEIATHKAVRAVWCNYRVHALRLGVPGPADKKFSTGG